MQAGDADVLDEVDAGAVDAHGEGGLGGDRGVRGAGRDHRHGAARRGQRAEGDGARERVHVGPELVGGPGQRVVVEPGREHRAVGVLRVQGAQDRDHLGGRLARAVHDLGVAGAPSPVEVDAREAEVCGARVGSSTRTNLAAAAVR